MINVLLEDGTYLICSIYESDKSGEYPILNHERINYLFKKKPEFKDNFINFQTEMINGKFHPNNVIWYEITHDNEYNYTYPEQMAMVEIGIKQSEILVNMKGEKYGN